MTLLERSRPLEELGRLATEAASGRGRLVLVRGEAGVGKTTLVRHFTDTLPPRHSLLWGACDPLSLPRPLGPLIDVAATVGEGFQRLLDLEAPRARLFSALRDVLSASTHVFVIEDVHWADDATLDLLSYLGRRLDSTRSLLVATYRDDEVGPRHPVQIVLGELATSNAVRRLKLETLSPEGVHALAAGSGLDPRELHQRTGGNPFFVTEVLAAGGTSLPPSLRDAVRARTARLTPMGIRALEAAAVLGPRFPPALLAEIDAVDDDSFEECLSSGILVRDAGMVAFRHELSRDAILELVPPARGTELHRKALAVRRRGPVNPDSLATLADHAEAAGDGEAVLELAPRAARRAAELRSHREAAAQYERALRWADALPAGERAVLYESRSYECYLTNQFPEALSARQRALALWREVGDAAKVGDSHRWLSRLFWYVGRKEDAERHAREALVVLETLEPGVPLAWGYAHLAHIHMLAAHVEEAEDWGNRAIALAEQLGEREVLCHALNSVGTARWRLEADDASAVLVERSLALALELGLEDQVARAYANLGTRYVAIRQFGTARRYLQAGIKHAIECDLETSRLYLLGWLGLCEFWEGRYAVAVERAEELLKHPRLQGPSRIQPLLVLGRVRARRGSPQAWEVLDDAQALAADTGELQRIGPVGAARAEAAWLAGELARAGDEVRPAFEMAVRQRHHWMIGELGFWLWRAGGAPDPPADAAPPYVLQMHGQARAAAERWRAIGAPYEMAMALADLDDEDALR